MTRHIHGEEVTGVDVDAQTRCAHYNSELDIIAIKFKCCERWFPCFECHKERADHKAETWPPEAWNEAAILCGVCGHQMTINEYMASNNTCPKCKAGFNPGCANHYELYFG